MTDTEMVPAEETAKDLATYDYGGLYQNVEPNYKPSFNPWRVKLIQSNSPEVAEGVEGAKPGVFMVGPMDGTGRDVFVEELNVMLLDYYEGRIANERDSDGKPVGGTDAKRVCGSFDGVKPFIPQEVRAEFGEDPVEIKLIDWRRPDVEVVITDDTYCENCPMSAMNIVDDDGRWLSPPCQKYHRVLMYSVDFDQPIEWSTGSYNVLKPLEGRKRGNTPGIRAMSYPRQPGEPPAFVLADGPHAITITSETVRTNFGVVRGPVLKYSEEPMTPAEFHAFVEVEKMYSKQKEEYRNRMEDYSDGADDVAADNESANPDGKKARDILGQGKHTGKNRRLGMDEDEL